MECICSRPERRSMETRAAAGDSGEARRRRSRLAEEEDAVGRRLLVGELG